MVTGWNDFFLPPTLNDYIIMQSEGKNPYLTIGPWTHIETATSGAKEGILWLRAQMLDQQSP